MKSMTGYGHSLQNTKDFEVNVEISSLNKKVLEVFIDLNKELQHLETLFNQLLRAKVNRGKVVLRINIKNITSQDACNWDQLGFQKNLNAIKDLAQKEGIPYVPDLNFLFHIFKLSLATNTEQTKILNENDTQALMDTFHKALDNFEAMRKTEGLALQEDLEKRIEKLSANLISIQKNAPYTIERYRLLLLERLKNAKLDLDITDERILKEIALFADRCDISEEITRLFTHFQAFKEALCTPEPAGRKLDFLCQEMQREWNTLCSKANNIEITHLALDSKLELEKIREQVQNIE